MPRKEMYFSNLDALRFISFLFIFWGHALDTESVIVKNSDLYAVLKNYVYILGKTGFSFAFVLSSYINTWVILEERESSGKYHPLQFYIRRALRIWPLYFLMIFVCFVFFPLIKMAANEPFAIDTPAWPFLVFVGNFYMIEHGFPYLPALSVLWSVSVEEQFYLLWPWLLLLFHRQRLWLISLLLVVFIAFMAIYFDKLNVFFHSLFLCGDIGIGALFAFISFQPKGKSFQLLSSLPKVAILSVYAIFLLLILRYKPVFENELLPAWLNLVLERLTFASLLGFFIFEQNFCTNSFLKFGKFKVINYLGLISYGLFCFHEIGLMIAYRVMELFGGKDTLIWELALKPIFASMLIIPVAALSFKFFEMPFLKLKKRFYGKRPT